MDKHFSMLLACLERVIQEKLSLKVNLAASTLSNGMYQVGTTSKSDVTQKEKKS